ncbi:MAG: ABC transporter permease subunit [Rhodothermales bacterium]
MKLASYEIRDVVRSRWVAAYGLFFLALTESLLRFGGGSIHALVSLVNVILLVVPMVGVVFGTMYLYGARDFIEMLLSQPVNRRQLYVGLYAGVAVPLCGAFLVGTAVPFLIHGIPDPTAFATLLGAGTLLTLIFVGFAFPIAIGNDERVRGLALALGAWLLLTLVYDGLVLFVVQAASDYPLEVPAIAMMLVNPVDLARVFLLMQFDFAALMGYTGAVFERFFGGPLGTIVSLTVLLAWAATPFYLGMRLFTKKDF